MTFNQFTTRFATEEQCREYLRELRWPNGFVCPKCKEATKAWPIGEVLYKCSKCKHQTSVIAGTIFQDTRTPLKTWFTAIWWVTTQKNGASAMGLQQILGLKSYTTAWTWLHKIRTAMVHPYRSKLSGVIEVDETYIGGEEKNGKHGRGTGNKVLVAVAVEVIDNVRPGRVRMQVIPDVKGTSLKEFVLSNIAEGSTVITDGLNSYSFVGTSGYVHDVVQKKQATNDDEMLPKVHMIVSLLKRWLLGTHQGAVSEKHMQAYLDEYVFRFNRRKSTQRGLLFYRLLENAMLVPPTTQDDFMKS